MEINYNSANALEAFLKAEGLGMRKRYGQNFLINQDTRLRLATALEAEAGEEVWEIGPGLGAMTRLLLDKNLMVKAFEIDPGFIRILHNLFDRESGFTLVEGDVLKNWQRENPAPYLLGNLPYNIASALIGDMTEKRRVFKCMVVTVQKELAQRMAAVPGTGDYSSFSVLCASAYRIKKLTNIHSTSFYPRPHVDSCGVKLELKPDYHKYPPVFYPLVRRLFVSRRKIIKNNLNDFISSVRGQGNLKSQARDKTTTEKNTEEICAFLLSQNRLSGKERAEDLDLEAFFGLAKTLENMRILEQGCQSL